jgi:hypothetical protein
MGKRKAGERMRSVKQRLIAICACAIVSAAVAVPATQANPPIGGATYMGTTSEGLTIVLVVNPAGTALTAGSYIEFTCGGTEVVTESLDGTTLLLPAGVTNRSGTGGVTHPLDGSVTDGFNGGTLSWRFFARFFASTASAGGQTQPPGDLAMGDFSGRNVTGIPGGVGFCSFRVTWTVP